MTFASFKDLKHKNNAEVINVVKVNRSSNKTDWFGVDARIWRHTIGRVSNGLRVPINLIASLFQGVKIIGKTIALPLTYTVVGLHSLITKNNKGSASYKGSMSIRGIAIDSVGFIRLLENVAVCFKNIVVAPHVKSKDFVTGLKSTWAVLGGGLQDYARIHTISTVFNKVVVGKKDSKKDRV